MHDLAPLPACAGCNDADGSAQAAISALITAQEEVQATPGNCQPDFACDNPITSQFLIDDVSMNLCGSCLVINFVCVTHSTDSWGNGDFR
jgi:hypothetical protein